MQIRLRDMSFGKPSVNMETVIYQQDEATPHCSNASLE